MANTGTHESTMISGPTAPAAPVRIESVAPLTSYQDGLGMRASQGPTRAPFAGRMPQRESDEPLDRVDDDDDTGHSTTSTPRRAVTYAMPESESSDDD
jgi:hypothetical protein